MSHKYYYVYYEGFANVYTLFWSNKELDNDKLERITRKEAIHLCVEEKWRQKTDPAFSGYASTTIIPYDYDYENGSLVNDSNYWLNDYIWEKR